MITFYGSRWRNPVSNRRLSPSTTFEEAGRLQRAQSAGAAKLCCAAFLLLLFIACLICGGMLSAHNARSSSAKEEQGFPQKVSLSISSAPRAEASGHSLPQDGEALVQTRIIPSKPRALRPDRPGIEQSAVLRKEAFCGISQEPLEALSQELCPTFSEELSQETETSAACAAAAGNTAVL